MRLAFAASLLLAGLVAAQSLADFEKRVTEFTLPNGLHFIIVERHGAPVVSFHTFVKAGAADDPTGRTGIAHMMEHMAFKGTTTIGTRNWPLEKLALDAIERAYTQLEAERSKGPGADKASLEKLDAALKAAIEKADSFVKPNEFDRLVESNGGLDLNASTSNDSTNYFYSFPSNRLELWFLLESERFIRPVYREFYKERDVVREERRMRTESSSQGLLIEVLLGTSFMAHPYKNSPVGWGSDISKYRMPEAMEFFKAHYTPSNMVIAIAGDVDPKECRRFATRYFGRMPVAPPPGEVRTEEPEQLGERRVTVQHADQPFLVMAYKRPARNHPDHQALNVLAYLLGSGRTSLIYTEMVRDKKVALDAGSFPAFPGGRYPNLFLLYAVPNLGRTVEENEKNCYQIIDRVQAGKISQVALDRVKTTLRAELISKLDSNPGLAGELTSYHVAYGSWKVMFTELEEIQKITIEDIQRVARTYLVPEKRTVAWTYQPAAKPAAATAATEAK